MTTTEKESAQEQPLHPLVDLAARLLEKGSGGEPWVYPSNAQARLEAALVDAKGSPDVADGVIGLFHAAIALSEEEQSPTAAGVILKALHATRSELALADRGQAELQKQLDAGLDKTTKRAPKVGEKAPEGTVKPSSFPPPRRFRG
ncbi:hypothetical protein L6R52_17205 [Myxococcota bacterium]|nr:hypothetical protein [Myxococcota bacterium]